MNERINLPAQEWLGYDPEKGDIHGYTFDQMREFAELIIQECIKVADHPLSKGMLPSDHIREHFKFSNEESY